MIAMGRSTETTGMNAVCDDCLKPLCDKLSKAIARGAGSTKVRVLRIEYSPHAKGTHYTVFIEVPIMEDS